KKSPSSQEELVPSTSYEAMRTTSTTGTNEINVHLLLSNDINKLRESALIKLQKLINRNCTNDVINNQDIVTLSKLSKLPKSSSWKGKRVFGIPLRIYQQSTGRLLPLGITNALQYLRLHAGKCDGLFRKPGVKSKIDRLRNEIEIHDSDQIKFDDYQPFVVADVVRQYFRELPECIIPPSITRILCDLIKCLPQEDQLLAIRYSFLLLPDETRDVLETILRFLFDVSIRSGASQTTCRSLARIFVPSVFQSYHELRSTKLTWWKWRKEIKLDSIAQESERLTLELCLMTMILNVDVLCRVPSVLSSELQLPSQRKTKRLDDLIRNECNGEFLIKKYISKESEQFFQQLQNTKYKSVQLPGNDLDIIELGIYKPKTTTNEVASLPRWKCSIDIPASIKQVSHRILNERYMWDLNFAESRIVEKLDDDAEIHQYVLNFLDLVPVRSFCEFRYTKKFSSHSSSTDNNEQQQSASNSNNIANGILISSISIDHLQNHFLPGSIGITHNSYFYLTPSTTQAGCTKVIHVASVDLSGRSTEWYDNVFGSMMAHNLNSLRQTFNKNKKCEKG
ncbi:unnamed protein product, partial [Didymodactylos carnosus]